jgi:hypothetical protein
MPAITWHCDCGAKYEIPEAALGRKVRCSQCGVVSLVEKPSSSKVPPPLPNTTVASEAGGVNSKIAQGQPQVDVTGESKKPILIPPAIWAHAILVSVPLSLLLLISLFVFFGDSSPQPGLEAGESALAKQMRKHKEESREAEGQEKPNLGKLSAKLLRAQKDIERAERTKDNLKNRSEFMRGVMRGIDELQANYQHGMGRLASAMGDQLEEYRRFANYEDEMRQASENPRLAPTFENMIDDPFGWMAATTGEYALLTLFCTIIFAGVFLWIAKQRSKNETAGNSERGITMLDRKETFFWIRVVEDDKVVYTYRNYRIFYFCILPLLILFTGVPVIGLIPILGWIFYWAIYPRPNRELSQMLQEAQCGATGSKLSAVNPMRITFLRTDFDRIVLERERTTPATTRTSSPPTLPNKHSITQTSPAPTMPSNRSENRTSDAEFEALKKKNEELKRKIEAKKLAEKRAKEKAALEAENARLLAELDEKG